MAKPDPIEITLGDKTFAIRPFTISQLVALENNLASIGTAGGAGSSSLITVALSRDHADVDLGEIETTFAELTAATKKIIDLAGFAPPPPQPGAA